VWDRVEVGLIARVAPLYPDEEKADDLMGLAGRSHRQELLDVMAQTVYRLKFL
jgi:hypothetical protein